MCGLGTILYKFNIEENDPSMFEITRDIAIWPYVLYNILKDK